MQTITENLIEVNQIAEQNYNNWQDITQKLIELKKMYEEDNK